MTDGIREESGDFPKIVGNMAVLSRDAVSGYKLGCGCGHEFMYVPVEVNSITTERHGTVKTHAICPECKALWFEDAEFVSRRRPVHFAYYYVPEDGNETDTQMAGIGTTTSRSEAANVAGNDLRDSRVPWKTMIVKILSDKEHKEFQEKVSQANNLARVALLEAMLGFHPGEKKGADGR